MPDQPDQLTTQPPFIKASNGELRKFRSSPTKQLDTFDNPKTARQSLLKEIYRQSKFKVLTNLLYL